MIVRCSHCGEETTVRFSVNRYKPHIGSNIKTQCPFIRDRARQPGGRTQADCPLLAESVQQAFQKGNAAAKRPKFPR